MLLLCWRKVVVPAEGFYCELAGCSLSPPPLTPRNVPQLPCVMMSFTSTGQPPWLMGGMLSSGNLPLVCKNATRMQRLCARLNEFGRENAYVAEVDSVRNGFVSSIFTIFHPLL
mgnify:CR=1 FL=1